MKYFIISFFIVGELAFANYEGSTVSYATAFAAKEMCSCLFVMEQSKKYCQNYIKNPVFNPPVSVSYNKKSVSSSILGFWKRVANYTGQKTGCRLN